MLGGKKAILQGINAAGILGTQALLNIFDTDGAVIEIGGIRKSTKGQLPKEYQTHICRDWLVTFESKSC